MIAADPVPPRVRAEGKGAARAVRKAEFIVSIGTIIRFAESASGDRGL
jgi:hypothetical protein